MTAQGATLPRLLLVECPDLGTPDEDDGGEHLRRFGRVVEALSEVCPWVDALRPGICTLPIKGPTRYFGTEEEVLGRVAETVATALGPAGQAGDRTPALRLGVAEGVFAAALAARGGTVVPPGETARFLAPWPVDVLGDPGIADVLVRLGLSTLGRFAAVPEADVLARFGTAAGHGHRVARAIEGELPGYRVPGMGARLVAALGRALALEDRQPGFWGGTSAADERAAEALTALQRRLGTAAVTVPVLEGGRGPDERCRLVPWRPAAAFDAPALRGARRRVAANPPWPGRLPPPAPSRVHPRPPAERPATIEVEIADECGALIGVTARGLFTGTPSRLSAAGGPWTPLAAWSAPWPVEERWWSRGARRVARLQVLTAGGEAHLLVTERGRWRLEATYD